MSWYILLVVLCVQIFTLTEADHEEDDFDEYCAMGKNEETVQKMEKCYQTHLLPKMKEADDICCKKFGFQNTVKEHLAFFCKDTKKGEEELHKFKQCQEEEDIRLGLSEQEIHDALDKLYECEEE